MNFPSSHQSIIKVQLFLDSQAVVVSQSAQNSSFYCHGSALRPVLTFLWTVLLLMHIYQVLMFRFSKMTLSSIMPFSKGFQTEVSKGLARESIENFSKKKLTK